MCQIYLGSSVSVASTKMMILLFLFLSGAKCRRASLQPRNRFIDSEDDEILSVVSVLPLPAQNSKQAVVWL